MASTWTPSLAGRNPVRYLAIVDALADSIRDGLLAPGAKLPTHRDLAWRLGVNTSTVTEAYREAARRHLVSGEVGRGTFVLAGSREAALFQLKACPNDAPDTIDLSTNVPAQDPNDTDLHDSMAALVADGALRGASLGYHDPALLARACVAGAGWLAATRGLHLRPADVAPCAGAQAALVAVLLALCAPGDAVLVEELTFPGIKAAARQLRLPLHGVAMDAGGVLPDALDRAARATGAKVAVLVPSLQNPTGAAMDAGRREVVAAVARRHGLWVVEDDVYGPLTDQPPLAALLPERGVLVTSLSKTVAAGLRFGIVAGACAPVRALSQEVHATSWPLAPLMADVACRWIADGTAARRLAWQRAEVAARGAMARRVLGLGAASPHLWLPLRGGSDAAAARCRAAGVDVVASTLFAVTRDAPDGLRVSLAAARSRAVLAQALERLRAAYPTPTSSTSNTSVALGGITPPAPRAP